mmetsp:Transcript_2995/g.5767  ORF Transcript_2995/g.5767 Transcript_2995/m.5767 type:complete len:151 (-) Transcript_2995:241-693(-)
MDITGRAFAVADGGFGGSISSDGDVSTTSTVDKDQDKEQATVQHCGLPRRVCFIDEIGISPRRDLVTSIVFRPSTTTEEKKKLQYSPQDYAFFAMGDDYQREFVPMKRSEPQVFRWEDFVVYDGGYVDEIPIEKEEAMCEGGTVPRVETL